MCYNLLENWSGAVRCGLGISVHALCSCCNEKKPLTYNLLLTLFQFVMNIFQQITDYVKRQYSTFDMKNNWIGSVNGFGSLNAIYHSIVLPSDTWKLGHNLIVKLPPLVAPAFTRIKGIVNSYYCSFASVWNYWNSFISDKPEDVFLSRSLTAAYKGKFVEPCVRFNVIALICKIARGFFPYFPQSTTPQDPEFFGIGGLSSESFQFFIPTLLKSAIGSSIPDTPTSIVWSLDAYGRRKATLTSNIQLSEVGTSYTLDATNHPSLTFPLTPTFQFGVTYCEKLGFSDFISYMIFQCQEVERNLSNHGVPTDEIAKSSMTSYKSEYFNLLPFMCESSIWHNFYRDEQNQSPEFDYREVNGCMHHPTDYASSADSSMPCGWKLRLLGIPPNVSTGSDYWFPIDNEEKQFAVLTGYMLEPVVANYFLNYSSQDSYQNITIIPKSYNGLLCLKYRNFEKDYFTSASVDPNFGGVSVQVPSTIDALRTASKLEEFLEVSASARDFYNFMKHLFGTNPESTRYQKPLLLGTQVVPIQIGEQLQTSETNTTPLGERAGIADGYGNSGTCNHFFNEHGLLVSYLSFVLDSQYMQGLPHEFNHHLQLDYPFPQFANLGAESIPLKEIYIGDSSTAMGVSYSEGDNNGVVDASSFVKSKVDLSVQIGANPSLPIGLDAGFTQVNIGGNYSSGVVMPRGYVATDSPSVFGYTPRYSRWKFKQDVVAGQMRDTYEFWHTFRHFSVRPYISNAFVSYMDAGFLSNLNRIFAVVNDNHDKFFIDCFNNGSVRRCLPLVPQTTMD